MTIKRLRSLTFIGIFLRIIARFHWLRPLIEFAIRGTVKSDLGRSWLNSFYNWLELVDKAVFQSITAKSFVKRGLARSDKLWETSFLDKTISMPLRGDKLWLDWDNAVSIVAHDPEVKLLYAELIRSDSPPETFFDIGANYGTHSLLLIAHGVKAFTFEPNPSCLDEFRYICELNRVVPKIEAIAIGSERGRVNFWFPERETWLGTIRDSTKDILKKDHELTSIEVDVIRLDDFTFKESIYPDLIKIDTEGNEANVLNGARETIKRSKPKIVFEANSLSNRNELWEIFEDIGYQIQPLTVDRYLLVEPLKRTEFISNKNFNFLAMHLDSEVE